MAAWEAVTGYRFDFKSDGATPVEAKMFIADKHDTDPNECAPNLEQEGN